MSTTTSESPEAQRAEITRLVEFASERGKPDAYTGKRDNCRYRPTFHIDVTTDPSSSDATFESHLHNLSLAGVAFWSRKEIPPGTNVFLRESDTRETAIWVEATITHCSFGIRGFLVGGQFNNPAEGTVIELSLENPDEALEEVTDATETETDVDAEAGKRGGLLGWLGL